MGEITLDVYDSKTRVSRDTGGKIPTAELNTTSCSVRTTEDSELVERFIKNQDNEAFSLLVRRHLPSIRKLIYTVLGEGREDREDAEQEILIALYHSLPRFRSESSFKTYLYRLCRNRAIDIVRKRTRQQKILNFSKASDLTESHQQSDPVVNMLEREKRKEVLSVLSRLKPESRTIVFLKDVEDLTIHEISRIMKIPKGTVKSRLHRIRNRIAILMKNLEERTE